MHTLPGFNVVKLLNAGSANKLYDVALALNILPYTEEANFSFGLGLNGCRSASRMHTDFNDVVLHKIPSDTVRC